MLDLSVVIPTYNRHATLLRCLGALRAQTLDPARYEIVVVDDGSTDATMTIEPPAGVRLIRQPQNAGPAAARNAGVLAANGAYVLFLGDDTLARPDLLAGHLSAHVEQPGQHMAVLGYTPWSAEQEITPLMRYLFDGRAFQQFRYHAIENADDVPFGFFYTCNLSLSRRFLIERGLFDESFRHAYGEDTELAYRLHRQGMRLIFRRDLVVDHEHPTSYRSARRRAAVAGQVAWKMAQKHPELADLSFANYGPKTRLANAIKRSVTMTLLDPLLDLADRRRWDHPLLAQSYNWALRKHQLWGLLDTIAARRADKRRTSPAARLG